MEGSALRQEREYDLAIAQAYHTAKFGNLAQAGKLKGLSAYQSKKKGEGKRSAWAGALSFFHNAKASGVPVEITRVIH
jgi:hypothetical protein